MLLNEYGPQALGMTIHVLILRFGRFIERLPNKLRQEDKGRHMILSFWLMLAALWLWPPLIAVTAVFLIGLAKECWDHFFGSGFCFFDMAGNVLGILAGLLLVLFASMVG